ncbi:type II secretion system protein M (GspM) [Pseudomonas graminis]|nr:type II secretion system protein M (GspM) [Pseudomonas graminis]
MSRMPMPCERRARELKAGERTTRALTPRERRGAALIVLALLMGAGYWLFIDSWFAGPLREMGEETEQLRSRQQRYAGLLQQRDSLNAALETAGQDPASSGSLLTGEDPSAVAADLMQHVADVITAQGANGAGCTLTQRMPITPEQEGSEPFRQVKVSVTLECAVEPLMAVLQGLEYQRPLLFIDHLSVRRVSSAPAKGGAGRLAVQLLIRGYLQPVAAKAAADQPDSAQAAP